jgi:hypothetical protein
MMQDYDPKWSAIFVVDHLTNIVRATKILTLCLEQLANNPPDLVPRLHWLILTLHSELECMSDDGLYHAKQVRNYLYQLEPGEDDEDNRPDECS